MTIRTIFGGAIGIVLLIATSLSAVAAQSETYDGQYCSGKGNVGYLRMIDQSFEFFHPNPYRQNISMLYIGKEERLCENGAWYMWWVQNSYGTTYCCLPFLREPWVTALQNAQDLWFKYQGDGKRIQGFPPEPAPLGSLCDCAGPNCVIYKQGDMDTSCHKTHDWFYEAAAAGVVMQGEILLISRDMMAIKRYVPKLDKACNFVETTRDPKNNLFLVGAGANLLAPSYGGILKADGTYGKGYLAGLSVNYLAAVDRMIELYKILGDKEKIALYEHRRKITIESLPLLLVDNTYFVKSLEETGVKHGVFGQKEFGYFEVAPNVDAVCFRSVSDELSRKIVDKTTSIPELRPFDMLITNYPTLDDIYTDAGSTSAASMAVKKIEAFGKWVNGGVWTTMEARALMAYARTGHYDDLIRSMKATLNFANRHHMDAPLGDFGKSGWYPDSPGLCYDALGPPAAVARGLFEYIYKADSLELYPHIPASITYYAQKEKIRFGKKLIAISIKNGGPRVSSIKINGKSIAVKAADHVVLNYAQLPSDASVEIVTSGTWANSPQTEDASFFVADPNCAGALKELPPALLARYNAFKVMREKLTQQPGAQNEKAFIAEAIACFDAYAARDTMNSAGAYSHLKDSLRNTALAYLQDACNQMYDGFDTMMLRYKAGYGKQKKIAAMWAEANTK